MGTEINTTEIQEITELSNRLKELCIEKNVEMNLILLYDGKIRCFGCGDYPLKMVDAMITVVKQIYLKK